jgi:hypothetical protein
MQDRCTVCVERTIGSDIILDAPVVLQVMWAMWNHILVQLEMVLVSVQDRCMVCTEHTLGSKIVLDEPDATPW